MTWQTIITMLLPLIESVWASQEPSVKAEAGAALAAFAAQYATSPYAGLIHAVISEVEKIVAAA